MKLKNVVGMLLLCAFCITAASSVVQGEEKNSTETPSLYDRLGGLPAISVVVSDLLDAMDSDSMLNENPAIAKARHAAPKEYLKFHVTSMVCQATGGPCTYIGKDMASSHAHLNINEAEWARMGEILTEILAKYKVPETEVQELFAILGSTKSAIVTK